MKQQSSPQKEMSVDSRTNPVNASIYSAEQDMSGSKLPPLPQPTPNQVSLVCHFGAILVEYLNNLCYVFLLQDPLHCFVCKNEGDFINCSVCTKPYHLFCADLERMPQNAWECKECQIIARDRLIRELKEKSRLKALEREHKKI